MLIQKQNLMMNLLLWIVRAITNLPARINKKWKYLTFENFANLKQSTMTSSHQSHKACTRKPCGLSGGIEKYWEVSNSIEQHQAVSSSIEQYWAVSSSIEEYQVVSSSVQQYRRGFGLYQRDCHRPKVFLMCVGGKKRRLFLNSQLDGMFDFTPHPYIVPITKSIPISKSLGLKCYKAWRRVATSSKGNQIFAKCAKELITWRIGQVDVFKWVENLYLVCPRIVVAGRSVPVFQYCNSAFQYSSVCVRFFKRIEDSWRDSTESGVLSCKNWVLFR